MTQIQHIRTELLDVAYEAGGPADGPTILLLHGWPDDVRTFDAVAAELQRLGFRTYAPYLRGFGETRFLSAATPRSGQIAAMAQDVLDLADALHLDRFAIIGHDWGARIGYFLASLHPDRVERLVALSVGWEPGGLRTPALEQARRFWYQWFMATERGAEVVRRDGVAFARFQWQTWSPPSWFDEAVFAATAAAFQNADWPEITIHSYRVRWGQAEPDPRYAELEGRQQAVGTIDVPTLVIHGGDDRCVSADTSAGKDAYFTGGYARHVLPGIGHFPTRESANEVVLLVGPFLSR